MGLVYGWGLLFRSDEARHVALTGIEEVGLSSLKESNPLPWLFYLWSQIEGWLPGQASALLGKPEKYSRQPINLNNALFGEKSTMSRREGLQCF